MKAFDAIGKVILSVLVSLCAASGQVTYPLHPGDQWKYLYSDSSFASRTSVLGDTTLVNGFHYALVQNIFNPLDTGYWRQDSMIVYRNISGIDRAVFAFDRAPGDTVGSYRAGSGMIVTIFQKSQYEFVFGQVVNVFYFITDTTATAQITMTRVADGFGIIYASPADSQTVSLGGAIINGVTYGTITGVDPGKGGRPAEYALWQNYPNPFNPGTTIRYAIPERSAVTLSIFNAGGQTVAVPLNGVQREAGTYELRLDASSLASGLYFYRITAAASHRSFTQTRKLLVLR